MRRPLSFVSIGFGIARPNNVTSLCYERSVDVYLCLVVTATTDLVSVLVQEEALARTLLVLGIDGW